jgi:integrase
LDHKLARLDVNELSPRTWTVLKAACDLLVGRFGKARLFADLGPEDFAELRNEMAQRWGPFRVRDFVRRIRSVFTYGKKARLINHDVRFGAGFGPPNKKTMRLERARKGPRMFEAPEIRAMVQGTLVPGADGAEQVRPSVPLKAMMLLGVNCGFGNADCSTLPLTTLDLDAGWVDFPQPKIGIPRRCPLWPETVAALREALARRPEPKDPADAGLAFLTTKGGRWHKKIEDNPISKEMRKLLDALGINGSRNFHALRHTFETVGGEAKDQVAVDHIMGHARRFGQCLPRADQRRE